MTSGPAAAGDPPRFITFEGGEGSGKSTQVKMLCQRLQAAGIDCVATREPGGAPGAEEIRRLLVRGPVARWDPTSEALLHFAARREHVEHLVRPALAAGKWVISDRFTDSTMAYQGYGHGLGRDAIDGLARLVLGDLSPDLTVILDLPAAAGLARASGRQKETSDGEDRYERMDKDFHARLRDGYLDIARREPARCAVIDATGTAETMHEAIVLVLGERLQTRLA